MKTDKTIYPITLNLGGVYMGQSDTNELQKIIDEIMNGLKLRIAIEKEKINLVKKSPDEVVEKIKSKEWHFKYKCTKFKDQMFVWICEDEDDVILEGTAEPYYTIATFKFDDGDVKLPAKQSKMLQDILIPVKKRHEIETWQAEEKEKRKIASQIKEEENQKKYKRFHDNHCIYCGKIIAIGSICDSCRSLYSKRRNGVGGYPSYDSNAAGSNNTKTYEKKVKPRGYY